MMKTLLMAGALAAMLSVAVFAGGQNNACPANANCGQCCEVCDPSACPPGCCGR